MHGNSQCAAADCQIGNVAHREINQIITHACEARRTNGHNGLIDAQHDQIGINCRADRHSNDAGTVEERLNDTADHIAELSADRAKDDQGDGNDDQHGEQRL